LPDVISVLDVLISLLLAVCTIIVRFASTELEAAAERGRSERAVTVAQTLRGERRSQSGNALFVI
jgi:hypothetical protein